MDSSERSGRGRKDCQALQSKTDTKNEEQSTSKQNRVAAKKMKVIDQLYTSFFPTTSTVSEQGNIRIGNTFFLLKGGHLIPKEQILFGKSITRGIHFLPSYHWNTAPPHPQQIPIFNMAPYVSGATGPTREIETELAAFEVYVTEKMLQTILTHTNVEIKIAQYYISPKPNCVYPLSINELKAFIGLLYLSALKKDNYLSPSFLWGVCCSDIYNLVMPQERFEYLAQCLRFDEYSTRNIREKRDSFSHIREIWDDFITKCSEVFRPSMNCTIDELFVNFNGNCRFKLPLPKEPQKHGIQIILLADSKNRYIMSGVPCLDNNYNGQTPLAEYMVEKLTKPIRGTHINITYANDMFTSIPLARRMLKLYKLTTIGAFHENHIEIPPDIVSSVNRPVGSFVTVYNNEDKLQLYTHCSKIGEVTTLLSSKYFPTVTKETEGKPKVIDYYNSTKEGVNAIKQMCYSYSCSRPTKHWYLAVFYTMLDLAAINSYTILNLNRARWGQRHVNRVDFLYKLILDLILPHLSERLTNPDTTDSVKNKIKSIMDERLKLNVKVNLPKYILNKIKAMYPPIEDDKSYANIPQKSTKMTIQQFQDSNPDCGSNIPVKSVAAELNTRNVSANLSMRQIQDKYSSAYNETMIKSVTSYLNSSALNIRQFQEMYRPFPHNSDVLGLKVNWNQIQALYPPTLNMNRTEQQTKQFYQPIQQPTVASFQNFQGRFRHVLMQETQTLGSLMQPTTPYTMRPPTVTSQKFTMNVNQHSTLFANMISTAPTKRPISDLRSCGVCNYVNDQNHFVQCAKCAVVVCAIHRQILCTNCIYNQPLPPNLYPNVLKNYQCGVCHHFFEDILLNRTQCYKCSQLLCLQHRHMLCCFCSNP